MENGYSSSSPAGLVYPEQSRKFRFAMLLLIVMVLAGFWGLAEEIAEEELRDFDASILYMMREPNDHADPIGPTWFEEAARDVTALGSFAVLLIVVSGAIVFLLLTGRPQAALYVFLSVLTGVILSTLLKSSFDRPRPDLVAHKMHTLTKSFPSGHSLLSATVYLTLGSLISLTQKKLSVKLFLILGSLFLAILVGVTRVYLGVHWPTDVLGGWFVGAAWALAWSLLALSLLPKEETKS